MGFARGLAVGLRCGVVPALLLACAGTASAEEAVLLASTAPGYVPGMVVVPGERLRLPEGASITLLLRTGQMLRLGGPFEASLDQARPGRRTSSAAELAEGLRMQGADASVIGGTRAAGLPRLRAEEIQIDAQRSGTYCIRPADTVWLLRPATAEQAEHALQRRGNRRTIAWPPGAARAEWPADVPIEDGDRFELLADGQAQATLTFRVLASAAPPSEAAAVTEGVLLGCREQYAPALHRLARAALPPELWLSTDRGRSPVYRSGEHIGLMVMADAEGHLYCTSLRADGSAVPVFPAGAVDGARLPGAVPAAIPGHRGSTPLRAGPRGTERIRCWLADRDISPELPHALLDPAGGRLPDRLAADLDSVFGGIAGGRIAQASLEIRVE
jgi:hypothetical protein